LNLAVDCCLLCGRSGSGPLCQNTVHTPFGSRSLRKTWPPIRVINGEESAPWQAKRSLSAHTPSLVLLLNVVYLRKTASTSYVTMPEIILLLILFGTPVCSTWEMGRSRRCYQIPQRCSLFARGARHGFSLLMPCNPHSSMTFLICLSGSYICSSVLEAGFCLCVPLPRLSRRQVLPSFCLG